jgi:hypothetical protein
MLSEAKHLKLTMRSLPKGMLRDHFVQDEETSNKYRIIYWICEICVHLRISYSGFGRPPKQKRIAPVFAEHPMGQTESDEI